MSAAGIQNNIVFCYSSNSSNNNYCCLSSCLTGLSVAILMWWLRLPSIPLTTSLWLGPKTALSKYGISRRSHKQRSKFRPSLSCERKLGYIPMLYKKTFPVESKVKMHSKSSLQLTVDILPFPCVVGWLLWMLSQYTPSEGTRKEHCWVYCSAHAHCTKFWF